MDAPEIVVGLDIGTTKIACLVGRKTDHGKIEILGVGKAPSVGVTRGVVEKIFDKLEKGIWDVNCKTIASKLGLRYLRSR